MKTKTVGNHPPPNTPEEFYALGVRLDAEAKVLDPNRPTGFIVKFRTWDDLERWENNRTMERAHRMRAHRDDQLPSTKPTSETAR